MMDPIEKDFLKNHGRVLYTGQYALSKNDALKYIKLLNGKKFILGGDLYIELNGNLVPDASSWSTEPINYSIDESIIRSERFINQFSDEENDLFFVIVVQK